MAHKPSMKFIVWCNIFLSLIMSIILSICFTVGQNHHLSLDGFLYTFTVAFIASLVVAFGAQLPVIGAWYGRHIGGQPGTALIYLFESAIQVTFFLVLVNLIMTIALTGVGFIGELSVFDRWWAMNMQFWSVAFIAFLVTRPIAEGLAGKTAGNPAAVASPAKENAEGLL